MENEKLQTSYKLYMETRDFILMVVDTVEKETGKKVVDVTFDIDLPTAESPEGTQATIRGVRFSLQDEFVMPTSEPELK